MPLSNYKIVEKISEGHFSFGYRAVHKDLGITAFVKQARRIDQRTITVFQREAKILGTVSIPGVPAFREYHLAAINGKTVPCIIMELVPGITCRTLVHAGPYDIKKTLWILYRAISILHKLHDRYHTAHCDLNPDNVLIDEQDNYGSVNIVDFGLAVLVNGKSVALCYQEDFPPPEFLAKLPVTYAADYYALGVIGKFLLTGGSMNELPKNTPPMVRDLIQDLLQENPDLRLQNYDALRTRIEYIQETL